MRDGSSDEPTADAAAWPGPRPRPRDATGRPLQAGAVDELGDGDPAAGCTSVDEAVAVLARCTAEGRWFPAHRVVLRLWRHLDGDHRELWGAVAQLTGGCVHAQRGNVDGARTLLERAAERLGDRPAAPPPVDVDALVRAAQCFAACARDRRPARVPGRLGAARPSDPAGPVWPGDATLGDPD